MLSVNLSDDPSLQVKKQKKEKRKRGFFNNEALKIHQFAMILESYPQMLEASHFC